MAVTRSRFTKDKPRNVIKNLPLKQNISRLPLKQNISSLPRNRSSNRSNPYAFADAGSLDTISRAPSSPQAQPTSQAMPPSGGGRVAGIDFFPAAADAGSLDTISRVPSTTPSRPSYTDYSAADAGSLDTTGRFSYGAYGVSPSYDGRGFAGALQDLSAQYPVNLTQDDIDQIMSSDFGGTWDALYDPVTGNTAQARYVAAGGGDAGLIAALGLDEENLPSDDGGDDDGGGGRGGGGGGGGRGGGIGDIDPVAYAQAINDYITSVEGSGIDYGALQTDLTGRYAGYGANLASIADAATARQQAAADRASAALAAIDPQAAFEFNVDPTTIGGGAAENYLRSIGASTAGVEGLRGFEQSLLNQQLAGARQFSDAQQSALDIERAARQAAVPQMLLESENALNARRMGYEMGLSESERAALEALLGRQSSEQQSIAERILNARLMAAQAGVTL